MPRNESVSLPPYMADALRRYRADAKKPRGRGPRNKLSLGDYRDEMVLESRKIVKDFIAICGSPAEARRKLRELIKVWLLEHEADEVLGDD